MGLMRKLAFRAWDVFNGCYTYSDKYGNLAKFFEYCQKCIDGGNMIIFEQSTGLKDKNGREIYEGDIVKRNDMSNCEVVFENEFCSFELKISLGKNTLMQDKYIYRLIGIGSIIEVIGNIYENKELLK